ncbi:MAG TPA: NADH-dependent [FeFe] hydrogenase, group A6 [bacterium]|nr:NADH-dependent [FeFe] hydrogenase, group A6 [bacterium]
MITIEVNGRSIAANEGETILDALRREKIKVPTLCHMPDLTPTGACRVCVVEVEGMRALVPSCAYPVTAGMKIRTHSPRAVRARKTIIELLLTNHPDDCLYCVRNLNCKLQALAEELGVRQRRYIGLKSQRRLDMSNLSVVRDPEKCILCGKCIRVCEEVQGVAAIDFAGRSCNAYVATTFDQGLNLSSCINCGQCIMTCPTGALREQSNIKEVVNALKDPRKTVVVQHAPSVSVTIAEEFGLPAGSDVAGILNAALRRLGFAYVFDTSFSADLTIMEEATELAQRISGGGVLPMFTSCSPGWVKFVEQFYPDFIPNLSSCKSPQQMLGAVIKTYFAEQEKVAPADIFSVSVMPCTAKKFEAGRAEQEHDDAVDIDAVLTVRELVRMIKMNGIDFKSLEPEFADSPFGTRSTAGKLFGGSGGVMEAALRTAHFLLMGGKELKAPALKEIRGFAGIKELKVKIGDREVGVAVASGLGNARKLLEQLRAGRSDLHFIEVMTCPGGCINGGGQPIGVKPEAVRARLQALYELDQKEALRVSHNNPELQRLYAQYLGAPGGDKAHHLLHTTYHRRDTVH